MGRSRSVLQECANLGRDEVVKLQAGLAGRRGCSLSLLFHNVRSVGGGGSGVAGGGDEGMGGGLGCGGVGGDMAGP
jgi:hypothetical protein